MLLVIMECRAAAVVESAVNVTYASAYRAADLACIKHFKDMNVLVVARNPPHALLIKQKQSRFEICFLRAASPSKVQCAQHRLTACSFIS